MSVIQQRVFIGCRGEGSLHEKQHVREQHVA